MLEFPTTGVARSVNVHNSNLVFFCDWLEANALFFEDRLSFSDVIDRLIEGELYDSQDFAWEFIGNSIAELRNRALHLQRAYPIAVTDRHLKSRNDGVTHPYLFCLLVSLLPFYSPLMKSIGPDRNDQAVLLEQLAELSLAKLFPSWSVRRTGWSRMSNRTLPTIAQELAGLIDSSTGDLQTYANARAKDCGLDVVTYRPFADGRGGYPCMLLQCASGHTDWRGKRKEPDIELWRKLVNFDNPPVRGFVIPFAIDDRAMRQSTTIVTGLVVDRIRLLMPGRDGERWVPQELERQIDKWIKPLLKKLPQV